jgi:hypothetical protein
MPGGRPTKLTPEVQERICTLLEQGHYYKVAARGAGIDYDTFREWVKKGNAAKSGMFHEFSCAVKEAVSAAEERLLLMIQLDPAWQAKAWILERRHPTRWTRTERKEISGPNGGPIQVDWAGMADGLDD